MAILDNVTRPVPVNPPLHRKVKAWWIIGGAVGFLLLVRMAVGGLGGEDGNAVPAAASTATSSPAAVPQNTEAAPATPDPATHRAYISALAAIDPDIVHGEDDKAVRRGHNQCVSIKEHSGDRARLVDLTQQRFTSPNHPEGFGPEKSALILNAVHQHLCPTY